ncbi:unannotated protein [freshwater metagenome]|uniref:Unannotated protein n=1 Tax=freshwater metagenome TaxID=449393 RepID=A0A6J7TWG4_9ZZZZ
MFVPVASLIACADAPGHEDDEPMMQAAAADCEAVTPPTKRERSNAKTANVAERMRNFTPYSSIF